MALVEVLGAPAGCRKEVRVMDATEGRHNCARCRSRIRAGEQFLIEVYPKPVRRDTGQAVTGFDKAYCHQPLCEE